jgi:hypothetical protein
MVGLENSIQRMGESMLAKVEAPTNRMQLQARIKHMISKAHVASYSAAFLWNLAALGARCLYSFLSFSGGSFTFCSQALLLFE